MTGQAPNPIGTDPSHATTCTAKEDAWTGQDHTTKPTLAEAPATIKGMHPAPHPTTTVANDTHQPNDTLADTRAKMHCTGTIKTHLSYTTFLVGVTLKTIPQTEADLVWGTLIILPTDCTQRRHQSHIQEQQPLIDLTTRWRSQFRIHSWTLPQNQNNDSDPLNY